MAIFDSKIFNPNIFLTDQTSSGTDSQVTEKRKGKSRGRSKGFIRSDASKHMQVLSATVTVKTFPVRSFMPMSVTETVKIQSVRLDDLDSESLLEEAKEQLFSATSNVTDIKTVKKTWQVVSMRPKRVRLETDSHSLITMARELVESATDLIEKPSLPQVEPSLYGDVPIDDYGEVEFQIDKKSHSTLDECDDYNGQVFSYGPDGLEDGAPIPPLHPSCRCKLVDTKTRQVMYFPGSEFEGS